MLHPPGNRRERLLMYGPPKAGKSTCWMDVAEWIYKTGSQSRIWLGDTDVAWEAMRPADGHLDNIVQYRDIFNMADHRNWIKEAVAKANRDRNDWLVWDMAHKMYDQARDEYYRLKFGKELDEFMVENSDNPAVIGGDFGKNWDVINKSYDGIVDKMHRFPGHVMAIVPAKDVKEPTAKSSAFADKPEVRDMYGSVGQRPDCKNTFPHLFHTVLYVIKSPSGIRLTTMGERNRKEFVGEVIGIITDPPTQPLFVQKYLIGAAGWRP